MRSYILYLNKDNRKSAKIIALLIIQKDFRLYSLSKFIISN